MRKLGIVALGAVAALSLAGCATGGTDAPAADENAEIRVWLVGTDTPDEARELLKTTFEKEHPGSTLTIEEQSWDGLVDKLTTSLSGSDSPDVVEVGNTQASAFTSAGAFLDLTDKFDELGGDDLLPRLRRGRLVRRQVLRGSALLGRSPRVLQEGRTRGRQPHGSHHARRVHLERRGARDGQPPRQVGHLVARPGLVQRAPPLHLGERRRGRGPEGRKVGRSAELGRLGRRPQAGPGSHDQRLERAEGRQRDRPRGRLLRRHDAAALGSELGQVSILAPTDAEAPGCPDQEANLASTPSPASRVARRRSSPVARTSASRRSRLTPSSPSTH